MDQTTISSFFFTDKLDSAAVDIPLLSVCAMCCVDVGRHTPWLPQSLACVRAGWTIAREILDYKQHGQLDSPPAAWGFTVIVAVMDN